MVRPLPNWPHHSIYMSVFTPTEFKREKESSTCEFSPWKQWGFIVLNLRYREGNDKSLMHLNNYGKTILHSNTSQDEKLSSKYDILRKLWFSGVVGVGKIHTVWHMLLYKLCLMFANLQGTADYIGRTGPQCKNKKWERLIHILNIPTYNNVATTNIL